MESDAVKEVRSHQLNQEYQTESSSEWLLNSSEFQHWINNADEEKLLWVSGNPGAGKTVLLHGLYEQAMQKIEGQI